MLCVTGNETGLAELRARMADYSEADLHEVRLDLLPEPLRRADDLGCQPDRLLLTCRPVREGGGYTGTENERLAYLESLLVQGGVAWLDLEASTDPEALARLGKIARQAGTRVLISAHDFEPGGATKARQNLLRLAGMGGDAVKLAVAVSDAVEVAELKQAGEAIELPTVLIAMGEAGLISRACYSRMGSQWTYVSADAGKETAPGQLPAARFASWRLPPGPETGLYALLGGPQVMHSPGPAVYNHLFSSRNIDACYLPIVTQNLAACFAFLRTLGLKGASVTMPLKAQAAQLADELGPEAEAAGVVNTLSVGADGKVRGDLTDGIGALAAITRKIGKLTGLRAVILGTGDTAAAIAHALCQAGVELTVLGRRPDRAEVLAARCGGKWAALDQLASLSFDILVQATPVGADDREASLVKDARLLAGKTVLDVVVGAETRLLRDTRKAGGTAIAGRAMWAEQGRRQLARWLNLDVTSDLLEQGP